jgi:hypothetical protein
MESHRGKMLQTRKPLEQNQTTLHSSLLELALALTQAIFKGGGQMAIT